MIISIGDRKVGDGQPVFVIAELSCNHLQDYDLAVKTIKAMKDAGADCVKLQTDDPDGGITIDCDNKYFKIEGDTLWDGKTLHQLYKETYTPWEWHEPLKKEIEKLGMICFSTPSCERGVDLLEELGMPAYKIASFEITNIPLIEYAASKNKPIIISTGIATLSDIELALDTCRKVGNEQVILLKCTSSYPTPLKEANLLTIPNIKDTFGVTVGLSDHTMGGTAAATSVALGARVVEKHFILDRSLGGPDAAFSMEPAEFKAMVDNIRDVEKSLGKVTYNLSDKVKKSTVFRSSLFIVKDMNEGETITKDNVRPIRPGYGLHPKYYKEVLGKKVRRNLKKGTPLKWDLVE